MLVRREFRRLYGNGEGIVVFPVIHVKTESQTIRNVELAVRCEVPGVALINHDFSKEELLPILKLVRIKFPKLFICVNFLATTGEYAFPILSELAAQNCLINAYWADDARIQECMTQQGEADKIAQIQTKTGLDKLLYIGGVAFKKQRAVDIGLVEMAARIAKNYTVVCTSGIKTGAAASRTKIARMRQGCGNSPLVLASGVTPENLKSYAYFIDLVLCATGISDDFYNLNERKLMTLLAEARKFPVRQGWYLDRMAPNVRGEDFAWLDPSALYLNPRTMDALVNDLSAPFNPADIDIVAGIDAMGFVLATAIARKLRRGIITFRKRGKLCVEVEGQDYVDYSRTTKRLEVRKPAWVPDARVLIVDQWVETGGTMQAAIKLVESLNGTVAGLVAIAMENPAGRKLRDNFVCASAVLPDTEFQKQVDSHYLSSFKGFDSRYWIQSKPEESKM